MKAVLDTNVWLDWLVFDDPSSRPLRQAAEAAALELPASASTRAEWLDVLARPKFALDESARKAIAECYERHARVVEVSTVVELVCRDADDQKFLELAVASGAHFLVTRDRALLDLARTAQKRHALAILRPDASLWRAALAECLAGPRAARFPGPPAGPL